MPSIEPELHVVAAVIRDDMGRVLLAQRPQHKRHPLQWEFPGGKVEVGEAPADALARELDEELGVTLHSASPLIRVTQRYDYGDILLDVYTAGCHGEPHGHEGQALRWVEIDDLDRYDFPAANRSVVRRLQLPERLLITGAARDEADFMARLQRALDHGIRLVQLRLLAQWEGTQRRALLGDAVALCHRHGAKVLVNGSAEEVEASAADGLHLSAERLLAFDQRPLPATLLLCASCHDERELAKARELELDLVLLSPVLPTNSHPGAATLGWEGFASLAASASLPVYALGGMSESTLAQALESGGCGIAAITSWW